METMKPIAVRAVSTAHETTISLIVRNERSIERKKTMSPLNVPRGLIYPLPDGCLTAL